MDRNASNAVPQHRSGGSGRRVLPAAEPLGDARRNIGEERSWASSEAKYGFGGLLSAALPWLNAPAAIATAEYKPVQLHAAVLAGLRVPPTIITNVPEQAEEFAVVNGPLVYKSLSGELVADGSDVKAIYTTPIVLSELRDPSIAYTAHLFQCQVLDKDWDVRLTVVDDAMFAVALHSSSTTGHLDWRRDYDSLSYEKVDVPPHVSDGVRALMCELRLRYGALDFAVTTSGEWLFYEINPNGQWGWIEDATGLPIAETIADALIKTGAH